MSRHPDELDRLAAVLAGALEDHQLRRDDPKFAGETLIGMLFGFEHTRRLFCVSARTLAAEQTRVTRIVDCFLRAFAPERKQP